MNIPDKQYLTIAEAVGLLAFNEAMSPIELHRRVLGTLLQPTVWAACQRLHEAWAKGPEKGIRVFEAAGGATAPVLVGAHLAGRFTFDPFNDTLIEICPRSVAEPPLNRIEETVARAYGNQPSGMRLDLNPGAVTPGYMTADGRPLADHWGEIIIDRESFARCFVEAGSDASNQPTAAALKKAKRSVSLDAAREAINALWPDRRALVGVPAGRRDSKIIEWCKLQGKAPVSATTIKRALR